jgi:hypothetical protein
MIHISYFNIIMNPSTVTKCLMIQSLPVLPEIQEIIKSYAFYDVEEYHRHRFQAIVQIIDEAYSRKNGYKKGIDSDKDEWWIFVPRVKEDYFPKKSQLCLHAKSCRKCGNYQSTKTNFLNDENPNLCTRIQCHCPYQSHNFVHYYDGGL